MVKPKVFLVHYKRFHLSPSCGTPSQTVHAKRRIISYSAEKHWRIQNYTYKLGCYARKPHRWLLEYRWVKRFVWFLYMFHSIYSIGSKTSRRIYVSGERLTRKQLTSRPDHLWPEPWTKWWRNAKVKERQQWSHEKPQLDNARKLRGIYFIDPEDKEFKETIKNARKKLETSVAPAMPCKIMKNCGSGGSDKNKTKLARKFWKLMNPQECVWETRHRQITKTILQEKVKNSLQHYNLVRKFIPMPQAWKIPDARAAVEKSVKIVEKYRHGSWQKSETKKKWSMKQGMKGEKFMVRHWWISVISRIRSWSPNINSAKAESYSEVTLWKMIQDHTQYSLNNDHQHHRWQPQMSWTWNLPGCAGQAADAVSSETQVKMEDAPLFIESSQVRMSRYVDTSTKAHMAKIMVQYGRPSRSSWKEFVRSSFGRAFMWKAIRAVTKWTKVCDQRLGRLISYIHRTCEYRQYCHVGNTAQQCTLGLFQDSDFARDLEDSKSTSGGILCVRKPNVRTNKLDVEGTNLSFTQFYRSLGDLSRCKFTFPLSIFEIQWLKCFIPHQTEATKAKMQESHGETCRQLLNQTCENLFQPRTPISIWPILFTFHQARHILVPMLCCMSLRTMKPWLKW